MKNSLDKSKNRHCLDFFKKTDSEGGCGKYKDNNALVF